MIATRLIEREQLRFQFERGLVTLDDLLDMIDASKREVAAAELRCRREMETAIRDLKDYNNHLESEVCDLEGMLDKARQKARKKS